MEYSLCSDMGIIATSALSSSSSSSGSPSSSSSPSTNYPLSPPAAVTSAPPSSSAVSSSSSSPNSPPTDLPPEATSLPSSSRSVLPPVTVVVISSCAACKFLGQICTENCVLATCFPPDDLIKFTTVHRVFGASNIIKLLQELPESQRADAVSSMVFEANAILRDPVYGSVGSSFLLQKRMTDLQVQLAKAHAETISSSSPRLVSPSSSSSPPPPASTPIVVVSPCAACKILRRRCPEKCVFAPYFPPNDPIKFTTAHRVFAASNIIKLLQELPESQRADAVNSMVYEANARIRDPVYGCAGAICQLQKQINYLQEQLAKAHAMPTSQSHCSKLYGNGPISTTNITTSTSQSP